MVGARAAGGYDDGLVDDERRWSGEARLALAVILHALRVALGGSTNESGDARRQARLREDARSWLLATSTTAAYDFQSLADALDLDAGAIRRLVVSTPVTPDSRATNATTPAARAQRPAGPVELPAWVHALLASAVSSRS